ncbi:glycerophosphodiester phosphodiesterase [Planctomycetota bacterium]
MWRQSIDILAAIRHDFRLSWRDLILTDLLYKLLAFAVLTLLVSLMLRIALSLSGTAVLADQDILHFLMGFFGWITVIVVGGGWLTIVSLEQAALMTIVAGATQEQRVSVRTALVHTIPLAWPILKITARLVTIGLLTAAPFVVAIAGVILLLLRPYDINFYLTEKPPVFWITLGLIGTIGTIMVVVLLRVLLPAVYALPIFLFEGTDPKVTLCVSRQRTRGHLRSIMVWIVGWFVITAALSAIGSALTGLAGHLLMPLVPRSIWVGLTAVGCLLVIWTLVNLGVTVLGTTTLVSMLVNFYGKLGGHQRPVLQPAKPIQIKGSFLFRMSRRQWLIVLTVVLVAAPTVTIPLLQSVQAKDQTEVTAHRGSSAVAPENSMAAILQAIHDRADWVEIDVQESSDGVVLVFHDEDLKRLGGASLKLWNTSAARLRAVDIGSRFSVEFADQRIPTLEEVLVACKGKIGVNIELKHYGHAQELEQRVIDLVEAHDMQSEIVIMSLKAESIQKVRALRPTWRIGLLTAMAVGDLTRMDADFLAVSTRIATQPFVVLARRRDKDVYAWTVNDPIVMSTMISRGVKSLITDKPALAREVLRQRAALCSVERLLLELAVLFGSPPSSPIEDA